MRHIIIRSWEKNRTEIYAIIGGGYPDFVVKPHPGELRGKNIPVFCYHEVNYASLKSDLEYLSSNEYITIDADTFLNHLEKRKYAPRRSVVLTFDDGSRNLFDVVYPLLREYHMKGVAFIATAFHRDEKDEVHSGHLKSGQFPLNWQQIKSMHDEGIIDFQSHTHSHRYLPLWPKTLELEGSDAEIIEGLRENALNIEEDFRLSKKIIEERLDKTVRHIAFPNFNGTQEAINIGQSVGYRAFWWGVLPKRSSNMPGQVPTHIVRFKPEYLQRLPGKKRKRLIQIILHRLQYGLAKMKQRIKPERRYR